MEVVYNLNGGTNDPSNPSEYKIGTAGIKLKDPEKDGYKFIGWYTDAEFENRVLYIDGIRDKLVLYANWEYIEETGVADSSLSEQVNSSNKSPENPLNPLIFIIPSIILIVILLGLIVSAIKNRGDQYIDDLEEQDQEQQDLEEQDQEQQLEDLDSTRIIEQSIEQESEDSTYEIKFTP